MIEKGTKKYPPVSDANQSQGQSVITAGIQLVCYLSSVRVHLINFNKLHQKIFLKGKHLKDKLSTR